MVPGYGREQVTGQGLIQKRAFLAGLGVIDLNSSLR